MTHLPRFTAGYSQLLLCLLAGVLCFAEQQQTLAEDPGDLLPLVQAAHRNSPTEISPGLEISRRAVLKQMTVFQSAPGPHPHTVAWRGQTPWEEMKAEINRPRPDAFRLQILTKKTFYSGQAGLEQPAALALREAFNRFIQQAQLANEPDLASAYRAHMQELEVLLQQDAQHRPADEIRRHVAWLHWTGQAPELVTAVQRQAAYPNLIVAIRKEVPLRWLHKLEQTVDEQHLANNSILGVPVSGQVHFTGKIQPALEYEQHQVSLQLRLQGTSEAPYNTAVSGPIAFYNRAHTTIDATTPITWDGRQLVMGSTLAQCQTKTTSLGASLNRPRLFSGSRGGLVDRAIETAALRQADLQRPQAEQESSRLTQTHVERRMDERITELVTEVNGQIGELVLNPLARVGLTPKIQFGANQDYLAIGLTQPDGASMSAEQPPQLQGLTGQGIVCLHESALGAFSRPICGGAIWTEQDFFTFQRQVLGKQVNGKTQASAQPWTMMFDWLQPLSTRITAEGVQVTLRGQALQMSGVSLRKPFRVDVTYQIVPEGTALRFVRRSPVTVEWTGASPAANPQETAIVEKLQNSFSRFFLSEHKLDGLAFPLVDQSNKLSLLTIEEVVPRAGWLYFSIGKAAPQAPAAAVLVNAKQ